MSSVREIDRRIGVSSDDGRTKTAYGHKIGRRVSCLLLDGAIGGEANRIS